MAQCRALWVLQQSTREIADWSGEGERERDFREISDMISASTMTKKTKATVGKKVSAGGVGSGDTRCCSTAEDEFS